MSCPATTSCVATTTDGDCKSTKVTSNGPAAGSGTVVVQDTSVRVVESAKSHVVTNKTIVQRTTNTNAVQVNRYDTEGNLKSSDIDSTSWEDRDTKNFEWTNKDEPPPEALAPPASDDRIDQFFSQQQQQQGTDDKAGLVLATAERRDVPAVSWTGTSSSHQVDEAAGKEDRTTTKLDCSQWSASGETVWISSGSTPNAAKTTITDAARNGQAAVAVDGQAAGELSVDERRRRRCQENRSRKAVVRPSAAVRVRPSPTPPAQ